MASSPPAPTTDLPIVEEPAGVVEALGGTPPNVVRRRTSPVRFVLPPRASRWVGAFDRRTDEAFDRLRGRPPADRLFYAASALGDFSLLWHLVGTARALRSRRDEREAVRLAAALAAESALVNWGVKSLFRRARPVWEQDRPRTLRRPRSSSFPSGHASSAFLAATLLADGGRRRSAPLWYGLASVVAASRVHVRIHHGSDVVVGVGLGLALGHLVHRVWPIRDEGDEPSGRPAERPVDLRTAESPHARPLAGG